MHEIMKYLLTYIDTPPRSTDSSNRGTSDNMRLVSIYGGPIYHGKFENLWYGNCMDRY